MQLRRLALGALALGLAIPAAPVFASPKAPPKVCKQIKDAEGDGDVQPSAGLLTSPTLDILSADVSSGRNEVTGTIRLKSAKLAEDNVARSGEAWNLNFTVSGVRYTFFARWTGVVTLGAPELTGGMTVGGNRSEPAATLKVVGNDLVWTVARKAVDGLKKPKTPIFLNGANSGASSFSADSALAAPNTKYLDKSPSCLASK